MYKGSIFGTVKLAFFEYMSFKIDKEMIHIKRLKSLWDKLLNDNL